MTRAEVRAHRPAALNRRIGNAASPVTGPTLVVIGGLHANEPAGIEAAERVHSAVEGSRVSLGMGRLVSLRGNLSALSGERDAHGNQRRYIDEDLNRAFVEEPERRESVEQRERNELETALREIVAQASGPVYLLDLHTVSSDSPAFIAFEDSLPARRFVSSFPLPKVLGLEERLAGLLIDHATSSLGCVSCIAEAGRHDDPRAVDVHEGIILLALASLGMASDEVRTRAGRDPHAVVAEASGVHKDHFYDVRERVPIRDASFRMQEEASAFMPVTARSTVVAIERSIPQTTDHNGFLFLPNRQTSPRVDDDAYFVVARVGRVWMGCSAWLRRRERMHRWMPRLLPGIRSCKTDPHTILIAPEYAAVLRREILHLLGYRLVRWSETPYMSRRERLGRAVAGVGRSLGGIVGHAFRGGERAVLPEERDEDWIARRRALDVRPPTSRDVSNAPSS